MAIGPLAPGAIVPPGAGVAPPPAGLHPAHIAAIRAAHGAANRGPTHAERMAHVRNLLAAALIHHQAAMDAGGGGGPPGMPPGGPPGMPPGGPPGMPPGGPPPGLPPVAASAMPSAPGGMVGRPTPAFPFGGRR